MRRCKPGWRFAFPDHLGRSCACGHVAMVIHVQTGHAFCATHSRDHAPLEYDFDGIRAEADLAAQQGELVEWMTKVAEIQREVMARYWGDGRPAESAPTENQPTTYGNT